MQNNTKKSSLVSKFNVVEDQFNESDIKYSLGKKEIMQIRTVEETQNKSKSKNIGSQLFSVGKKYIGKAIKDGNNSIFKPLMKSTQKGLSNLKSKKHKVEINFQKFIEDVDTEFDKKVETDRIQNQGNETLLSDYTQVLNEVFGIKNTQFVVNTEDIKKLTLTRRNEELTNLNLLAQKLKEKNMLANVFAVKSSLTFNHDNSASHVVEFELKSKGLKWAIYFSKYVMNEVNLHLKLMGGESKGEYISNVSLGRDKYVVFMESNLGLANFTTLNGEGRVKTSLAEMGI